MTPTFVDLLILVIVFFAVIPLGVLFTFSPQTVIRWQAQFYRKANTFIGSDSQEVDRKFQLPWDKRLMGNRSDFAEKGSRAPESYKDLAILYRVFGMLLLALVGFAITLAVLFLVIIH